MRRRTLLRALGAVLAGSGVAADRLGRDAHSGFEFQQLHERGVTGDGVAVGVVDPTGFDPYHPAVVESVAGWQYFGSRRRGNHGTRAAEVANAVAPDADLYLAGYRDEADYRNALDWMGERADVILVPATFYGKPDDGSASVSRATTAATFDAVVVAAAGNLARRHWVGHAGLSGVRGRAPRLQSAGGRVGLWLSVRGDVRETASSLRLVGTDGRTVASADPYATDDAANQRLSTRVDPGTYRVVVETATPRPHEVALTSLSGPFVDPTTAGSIGAPATARRVFAVGAYDDGEVPPFSSQGPTADGRRGIDAVAPASAWVAPGSDSFRGSSAAAAYVAGVCALVSGHPAADGPDDVRAAIRETAVDIGPVGADPVSGHGVVSPAGALSWLVGGETE